MNDKFQNPEHPTQRQRNDDADLIPDGFVPNFEYEKRKDEAMADRERRDKEAVENAIAARPDKEPFDYQEFAKLYWKKDTDTADLTGEEATNVQWAYEKGYYLQFPGVNSIEDYARVLEELDSQSGN